MPKIVLVTYSRLKFLVINTSHFLTYHFEATVVIISKLSLVIFVLRLCTYKLFNRSFI